MDSGERPNLISIILGDHGGSEATKGMEMTCKSCRHFPNRHGFLTLTSDIYME